MIQDDLCLLESRPKLFCFFGDFGHKLLRKILRIAMGYMRKGFGLRVKQTSQVAGWRPHWYLKQLSDVFVACNYVCCALACRMGYWDPFLQGGWQLTAWAMTRARMPCCSQPAAKPDSQWHGLILTLFRECLLVAAAACGPGAVMWPFFFFAVMAYMQFVEDYSEPQPAMFYQTPQNEHIYQQKNKHLMEVYGFNDSFISIEPSQDLAPPPALPPKQRQLVSDIRSALPGRHTSLPGAALFLLLLFPRGHSGGRMSRWCYHVMLLVILLTCF